MKPLKYGSWTRKAKFVHSDHSKQNAIREVVLDFQKVALDINEFKYVFAGMAVEISRNNGELINAVCNQL